MPKRRLNWFLGIRLAGIVLFIVVLSRTNLKELWAWMNEIDQHHLLLAIMFQVILLLAKALRWYFLNESGFNLKKLLRKSGEFFEGYAMGVITPGRVGELMKAGHGGTRMGILGAGLRVIAERGMDLSIYFVIAGIALSQGVIPAIDDAWGWIILITGVTGMCVSMLILISPTVVRMVESILRLIRVLKRDKNLEFDHRRLGRTFFFLFLSVFSNLSYFISCYYLATGVGIDIPMISVAGGVASAGVINTIPVTVMGLGTREITFIYVFNSFPLAQVMAFSGLVFLIAQIGGGLFSLLLGQALLWKSKLQG